MLYVQNAPDIKSASHSALPDLLDKINLTKPIFNSLAQSIIEVMLEWDLGSFVFSELYKWFNSKNSKIGVFSMRLINNSMQNTEYMSQMNLKYLLTSI